jgi:hypothetical protein
MNQTGYGKMNYDFFPDLTIGVNLIKLDDQTKLHKIFEHKKVT